MPASTSFIFHCRSLFSSACLSLFVVCCISSYHSPSFCAASPHEIKKQDGNGAGPVWRGRVLTSTFPGESPLLYKVTLQVRVLSLFDKRSCYSLSWNTSEKQWNIYWLSISITSVTKTGSVAEPYWGAVDRLLSQTLMCEFMRKSLVRWWWLVLLIMRNVQGY